LKHFFFSSCKPFSGIFLLSSLFIDIQNYATFVRSETEFHKKTKEQSKWIWQHCSASKRTDTMSLR